MEKHKIQEHLSKLKEIQREIGEHARSEQHVERQRLLKLIDAELLDAIHNLTELLNFEERQRV